MNTMLAALLLLMTATVFGEDSTVRREDLFSYTHEKALTIAASYVVATRTLTLSVTNVTDEVVKYNEPVLVSAGNVHIRGDLFFYPPIGSGIYNRKPAQVLAGKTEDYVYVLPEGALEAAGEKPLRVEVFLDDVNGEKKRTPYKCEMKILK